MKVYFRACLVDRLVTRDFTTNMLLRPASCLAWTTCTLSFLVSDHVACERENFDR